jgi:hypothetical protein
MTSRFTAENTVIRFAQLWRLDEYAQRTQSLVMTIERFYPYNVFADESEQAKYGRTIFGVAAYVATFDRWLQLEERWREIIHKFKVPLDGNPEHTEPFFHMTDFIARKKQFDNDWPDTKRDEFMELLTRTASDHTIAGVACCVDVEEYKRVLPPDVQQAFREPYYFCVWGVLSSLAGIEQRRSVAIPTPLWFLFDRKKKAVKHASSIFYTTKTLRAKKGNTVLGDMGFGEMWRTPQLQAVDLLTYEAVRRSAEERDDPSRKHRRSLAALGRRKNLYFMHMNEALLKRYVELAREAEKDARQEEDGA